MESISKLKKIKVGLMAYGMSGKVFHAPFIEAHPGFQLCAVVERTKNESLNDYPNIKLYTSIEDLINDTELELIIVNTPNYLHYDHTLAALKAKKHVLVEKPFTPTLQQAKELFEIAEKNGLKLMVYQNRRYSSDFLSVKEILNSGVLGNLIELNFRFDRFKAQIGPKKFKEEKYPASGILYDLGAHILDQVISLFGKPLKYFKSSGVYRENGQVPDFGHFHLVYPNQIHVFITVSMLTANPIPGIVINGTKGTFIKPFSDTQEAQSINQIKPNQPEFGIEKPEHCGNLTLAMEDGSFISKDIQGKKGNMLGLFEDVYQYIRNNVSFPITKEEILIQLEILESDDN